MTELRKQISDYLASLGDNHVMVYESLKGLGCKGLRGFGYDCPVARAVNLNVSIAGLFHVNSTGWYVFDSSQFTTASGSITDGIVEFIQMFDSGMFYQDLVEEQQSADTN